MLKLNIVDLLRKEKYDKVIDILRNKILHTTLIHR